MNKLLLEWSGIKKAINQKIRSGEATPEDYAYRLATMERIYNVYSWLSAEAQQEIEDMDYPMSELFWDWLKADTGDDDVEGYITSLFL